MPVSAHLYFMEVLQLASESEQNVPSVQRADERAAFAALVRTYHGDLLRISYVILGDTELAKDAAQAAWTKAWGKFHQLREPDKVRSWLVAVAANEARQLARRKRPSDSAASPPTGFGSDADPTLIDLSTALERLSVNDRRLLGLRYALDLTSTEIGAVLGISAGAVRHRLMRLIERLREEIQ